MSYLDERRRAQTTDIKPWDYVVVKQEKSTVNPPWDVKPYLVKEVHGTKLYLKGMKDIRSGM